MSAIRTKVSRWQMESAKNTAKLKGSKYKRPVIGAHTNPWTFGQLNAENFSIRDPGGPDYATTDDNYRINSEGEYRMWKRGQSVHKRRTRAHGMGSALDAKRYYPGLGWITGWEARSMRGKDFKTNGQATQKVWKSIRDKQDWIRAEAQKDPEWKLGMMPSSRAIYDDQKKHVDMWAGQWKHAPSYKGGNPWDKWVPMYEGYDSWKADQQSQDAARLANLENPEFSHVGSYGPLANLIRLGIRGGGPVTSEGQALLDRRAQLGTESAIRRLGGGGGIQAIPYPDNGGDLPARYRAPQRRRRRKRRV